MQISGRNQLTGMVTAIKSGGVMSQISLDVNGQMITSAITNDSVQQLGLKQGDQVTALIKATDVMVMK